jgi:hypothetical protein
MVIPVCCAENAHHLAIHAAHWWDIGDALAGFRNHISIEIHGNSLYVLDRANPAESKNINPLRIGVASSRW